MIRWRGGYAIMTGRITIPAIGIIRGNASVTSHGFDIRATSARDATKHQDSDGYYSSNRHTST